MIGPMATIHWTLSRCQALCSGLHVHHLTELTAEQNHVWALRAHLSLTLNRHSQLHLEAISKQRDLLPSEFNKANQKPSFFQRWPITVFQVFLRWCSWARASPGGYPHGRLGQAKRAAMPEARPEEACGHESKQDRGRRENVLILDPRDSGQVLLSFSCWLLSLLKKLT